MADELIIRFWGARGSYPSPGAQTVKYGGNTACVEISVGGRTLVLDAGTGIIPLGRDLVRRPRPGGATLDLALFFSHYHHDHTQGFPFFLPAFMPGARLHIHGPGLSPESLESILESIQSPHQFPVGLREMAATKHIRSLRETESIVWDEHGIRPLEGTPRIGENAVQVKIYHSHAHPGGVYVYRIAWRGRSVVYATDVEGYAGLDRRLIQFAGRADVLIHDAQYLEEHYLGKMPGYPATQGYGHSTVRMAAQVADAAEAGRLVLFHHDPAYDDGIILKMEDRARAMFAPSAAAYEGMEIRLSEAETILTAAASDKFAGEVKYSDHG